MKSFFYRKYKLQDGLGDYKSGVLFQDLQVSFTKKR